LHAANESYQRDSDEEDWNGPERDALEDFADHGPTSCCETEIGVSGVEGGSLVGKNRWSSFAVVTAATAPHNVAISVVGMIAVGAIAPAAASTPMIVVGMNWIPAVFRTMNVTIGFDAVSLSGFSVCSSSIALMPRGVAALLRPS